MGEKLRNLRWLSFLPKGRCGRNEYPKEEGKVVVMVIKGENLRL